MVILDCIITVQEKLRGLLVLWAVKKVCKICEKELDRKEYIALRWKKNEDGCDMCGTCNDKLSGPVCENCFCYVCYVSVDGKCVCPK